MAVYHITLQKSVPNILARGLQPRIGPRAKELGEIEKAVHLYRSKEECQEALSRWFSDCFFGEEADQIVILELDTLMNVAIPTEHGGEFSVLELIPETAVKTIWSPDFKIDLSDQFEAAMINLPPQEEPGSGPWPNDEVPDDSVFAIVDDADD